MSEKAIQTESAEQSPPPPTADDLEPAPVGRITELTGSEPNPAGGDAINIVWGEF